MQKEIMKKYPQLKSRDHEDDSCQNRVCVPHSDDIERTKSWI